MHVLKSSGTTAIKVESDDNSASIKIDGVKTSDAAFGYLTFFNAGDSAANIAAYRDGANDAGALVFGTQPTGGGITERMRIKSDGKVGIGTTAPAQLLHVYKATGAVGIKVESVQDGGGYGANLYLQTYATNANAKIHFGDRIGLYGFIDYENSDDSMAFGTNNAERMRIKSNGYVGIGTTAPASALNIRSAGIAATTPTY